ncbi:MAG: hypothetical protein ACMUJM_21185 [bacterium]
MRKKLKFKDRKEYFRVFVITILIIICSPKAYSLSSNPIRRKAAELKVGIEAAADQGDVNLYTEKMQELHNYMDELDRGGREEFVSYWQDPSITTWMTQITLRLSEKMREKRLQKKVTSEKGKTPDPETVTEPLADVIRHLVKGIIGERNTLPRVLDVETKSGRFLLAYRTYSTDETSSASFWVAKDIAIMLPYLLDHPRLADIKIFRFEAYRNFSDRNSDVLMLSMELPRKTLRKVLSQSPVTQKLLDAAEKRGTLWRHSRLKQIN